ncbi:MAG TPA: histidine phosphatase family protein [Xanthobacteraceae bacterium]|nr:histidine phosphatase family protein [Xanthobacteraceae bacterium]
MTTRIILTRHGHVEGIRPRRFRGREDIPLTDLGRAQAKATAHRIAELWQPDGVFTSPMRRCVATGAAIADACGTSNQVLDTLDEMDYGEWQWKTHEEISRTFPELYRKWHAIPHLFRFPQGESLQDVVARVSGALRYVLQEHRDRTVVLVGHNTVCRALLMQILDQPLSAYWRLYFKPCGISEIEFTDDVSRVLRVNETFHLPETPEVELPHRTNMEATT